MKTIKEQLDNFRSQEIIEKKDHSILINRYEDGGYFEIVDKENNWWKVEGHVEYGQKHWGVSMGGYGTLDIETSKKLNRLHTLAIKLAEKLNKEVDAKLERNSKLKVYVIDDGTGREYGGAYKSKEQFILDVREKTRFSKSFIRTRMTESSNENVKSITQKHPNSLIPVTFECK
jgi:hypothetical protein